jgi:hypothetical protein
VCSARRRDDRATHRIARETSEEANEGSEDATSCQCTAIVHNRKQVYEGTGDSLSDEEVAEIKTLSSLYKEWS